MPLRTGSRPPAAALFVLLLAVVVGVGVVSGPGGGRPAGAVGRQVSITLPAG